MAEAKEPALSSLGAVAGTEGVTHTLIFVDVDGVLNVGISDGHGKAPLLLSDKNVERALRPPPVKGSGQKAAALQKLVAVSRRTVGGGEKGTFASLVSSAPADVSSILAGRLAQLIRAAGEHRTVVLSSSWRQPHHNAQAKRLEQEISNHLGSTFEFDGRTPLRNDWCPKERVVCIGDFVASFEVPPSAKLQLLVLDDFFISPMNGWECDGVAVDSTEGAERYLLTRCPPAASVSVRIEHTYDEWTLKSGLLVQVGVGLTMEHFRNAMCFVTGHDVDVENDLMCQEAASTKPNRCTSILLCGLPFLRLDAVLLQKVTRGILSSKKSTEPKLFGV
eukprot:CAMPEP_0171108874 /NCGR_PEP_ID=MMETSP0766_2-20121228/69787_1 /TAXON_ID=439317 /ORGANISM="Gambierdiscus australes, Strain CAWD 149" /LENGTH=333 /DNA_ID=CAMNT_0011570491 /DNA_START=67 /DNA_END=1068 /DNA_ORIENTATION=+